MCAKIPFPSVEDLQEESERLYEALSQEHDVPCILLSTSFLDQCLASLLERFLMDGQTARGLLNYKGVLGTFSARTDLTYCLGLISKGIFQNLRTLGEIRNAIAHSYLSRSFDDSDISVWCFKLLLPRMKWKRAEKDDSEPKGEFKFADLFVQNPKARFVLCVSLLANDLISMGKKLEQRSKLTNHWDPI